jgi:malate synthase
VAFGLRLKPLVNLETNTQPASHYARRLIRTGLLCGFALWSVLPVNLARASQGQAQAEAADPAVAAFNERVKQYVKLRKKAEGLPPKLSK